MQGQLTKDKEQGDGEGEGESEGPAINNNMTIEIVGAIIAEGSVILEDTTCTYFLTNIINNPSTEFDQNLILITMAHLCKRITLKKESNIKSTSTITDHLTPEIITSLKQLVENRKNNTGIALKLGIQTNLEITFIRFLGLDKSNKSELPQLLDQIVKKYPFKRKTFSGIKQ